MQMMMRDPLLSVIGLLIVVASVMALIRVQRWFDGLRTPASAAVYVLGCTFAFYCMSIVINTFVTQSFTLILQEPGFLAIPVALVLVATMQVMRKRREPSA
jgi:hypothetical protein